MLEGGAGWGRDDHDFMTAASRHRDGVGWFSLTVQGEVRAPVLKRGAAPGVGGGVSVAVLRLPVVRQHVEAALGESGGDGSGELSRGLGW